MDKENKDPSTCVECECTFKGATEKYKHDFNYHQESVSSEVNGKKFQGYELLKRHFNKKHTSSTLSNSKRKFSDFTFEEGCERQGLETEKSKAVHSFKSLGMAPVMLSMHDEAENNTCYIHHSIEKERIKKVQDLKLFEKDLTCRLKMYDNNKIKESNDKVQIVPQTLNFYDFLAFNKKMGEYVVINKEIECKLNKKKQDFFSLSKLFIGGLVYVKNVTAMILSAEVYRRDVSVDSHAESSYTSFPKAIDSDDRYYKNIKIISINQSEGGQPINKLIIGTASLSILITSTFTLTPRCDEMTTVGPTEVIYLIV
ncbi:hypothetical protein MFLAVUS_009325 [Mucor flavus]|uniref:C2H2-type domain-containing protein n=1 Tax=Mucor flavus TaxID=439312 RepID=A0ABP9Z9K7_9FUNG